MCRVSFKFLDVLFSPVAFQTLLSVPLRNKIIFKDWRSFFALVKSVGPSLQQAFPSMNTSCLRMGQEAALQSREALSGQAQERDFAVGVAMEDTVLDNHN